MVSMDVKTFSHAESSLLTSKKNKGGEGSISLLHFWMRKSSNTTFSCMPGELDIYIIVAMPCPRFVCQTLNISSPIDPTLHLSQRGHPSARPFPRLACLPLQSCWCDTISLTAVVSLLWLFYERLPRPLIAMASVTTTLDPRWRA